MKFLKNKIKPMIEDRLIEEVAYDLYDISLFLTRKGINRVKENFDLPNEIVNKKNEIEKGYYRASELKMNSRLVKHQIYLNQFVIDFKQIFKEKGYDEAINYFDEKYVSQYKNIRPDGLIQTFGIDFFLEMDMSTESRKQLIGKWTNYLNFLKSREFELLNKKIIVLFIIDGTNKIANRTKLVKMTANDILMDSCKGNFDIIVGSRQEIQNIVFEKIILNDLTNERNSLTELLLETKHDFISKEGHFLKNVLNDFEYATYIAKFDKENNIIKENDRIQEFILDYYYYNSLSSINKIAYFKKNSNSFRNEFKREINLLIVCNDLSEIYEELKLFNLAYEENIYFTTIEKLENLNFPNAICKFDCTGRIYSFENSGLKNIIY